MPPSFVIIRAEIGNTLRDEFRWNTPVVPGLLINSMYDLCVMPGRRGEGPWSNHLFGDVGFVVSHNIMSPDDSELRANNQRSLIKLTW